MGKEKNVVLTAGVVLFEGIDTCGKSTQIEMITQQYPDILGTREPGGTEFGTKVRDILLGSTLVSRRAELLLFLADRAEHYRQVIHTNTDKMILSDRGFVSGMGYALANGDCSYEELLLLNRFALEEDLPKNVIFFVTNRETLIARSKVKTLDTIELRGIDYLLLVQDEMKKLLLKLNIPYLIVDATQTREYIFKKILQYLKLENIKG